MGRKKAAVKRETVHPRSYVRHRTSAELMYDQLNIWLGRAKRSIKSGDYQEAAFCLKRLLPHLDGSNTGYYDQVFEAIEKLEKGEKCEDLNIFLYFHPLVDKPNIYDTLFAIERLFLKLSRFDSKLKELV